MSIVTFPKANTAISKTPLAAPTGLNLTVDSDTEITLDWTDVATDGTVEIYRSLTVDSGFELIDSVDVGTETYQDTGLTADTEYFYKIRAFDISVGYSDYSATESDTTEGVP
jgi:hypothetical protein